jgi:carbamoyl-phosphate synthase large subunit
MLMGMTVEENLRIDLCGSIWFLDKLEDILNTEIHQTHAVERFLADQMRHIKRPGVSAIVNLRFTTKTREDDNTETFRKSLGVIPAYKTVDTPARRNLKH